jgi:3-dehydroquinate synthetase
MKVTSSIRDYQVTFVDTMSFIEELEQIKNRFYIIDKKVWDLYSPSWGHLDEQRLLILPISEEAKCLDTVMTVYDALMKSAAKRNMTMISIGGGIIQDITGICRVHALPWHQLDLCADDLAGTGR